MLDDGLLVVRHDERARERRPPAATPLSSAWAPTASAAASCVTSTCWPAHCSSTPVPTTSPSWTTVWSTETLAAASATTTSDRARRLRRDRQRRVAEFLGGDRRGVHDLHRRCDLTGESLHGPAVGFGALPDRRVGTARCRSRHRGCLIRHATAPPAGRTSLASRSSGRPLQSHSQFQTQAQVAQARPRFWAQLQAQPSSSRLQLQSQLQLPACSSAVASRSTTLPTGEVIPRPVPARRSRSARPRRRASTRPRSTSRSTPTRSSRRRPRRGASAPAPRCLR